jgi:hypothetical protein
MIDLCYQDRVNESARPFDLSTLISELEASGLTFQRVPRPALGQPCLLFATVGMVAELSVEERSHVVLIAEGDRPTAAEADATLQTLGLLGLVEPRAWTVWQRGLFVAFGLYGRSDIAKAAGLALLDGQGLQPESDRESLPAVLARFLRATELRSVDSAPAAQDEQQR